MTKQNITEIWTSSPNVTVFEALHWRNTNVNLMSLWKRKHGESLETWGNIVWEALLSVREENCVAINPVDLEVFQSDSKWWMDKTTNRKSLFERDIPQASNDIKLHSLIDTLNHSSIWNPPLNITKYSLHRILRHSVRSE